MLTSELDHFYSLLKTIRQLEKTPNLFFGSQFAKEGKFNADYDFDILNGEESMSSLKNLSKEELSPHGTWYDQLIGSLGRLYEGLQAVNNTSTLKK